MKIMVFRLLFSIVFTIAATVMFGCEAENVKITADVIVTPTDTAPTLKVGLLQPPDYYPSFTRGAELARDEINATADGMRVEFVYRDERTDTFVETLTDLVDVQKVVGIIGPVFSSHAIKIDPSVEVPMLAGATDANRVTQSNEFIFLVSGSNVLHGEFIAQFAVETLSAATASIILQEPDVYSMGIAEAFDAQFQKLGGTLAGDRQKYPAGATDFTAQLTAIKVSDPDVLFLASFAPEVPRIMKAARDIGITARFIGGDGMEDPENMFGTLTDNTPLEGTYYTTNLDLTSAHPETQKFIEAYKVKFGEVPDGVAASGYDNVRLLMMAIETAASTDPVAVRDAIAATENYTGATAISHFDAQRRAVKGVGVMKIENGEILPYTFVSGETPNTSE